MCRYYKIELIELAVIRGSSRSSTFVIVRTALWLREWRVVDVENRVDLVEPGLLEFGELNRCDLDGPQQPSAITRVDYLLTGDLTGVEKTQRIRQHVQSVESVALVVGLVVRRAIGELVRITRIAEQADVDHVRAAFLYPLQSSVDIDNLQRKRYYILFLCFIQFFSLNCYLVLICDIAVRMVTKR